MLTEKDNKIVMVELVRNSKSNITVRFDFAQT